MEIKKICKMYSLQVFYGLAIALAPVNVTLVLSFATVAVQAFLMEPIGPVEEILPNLNFMKDIKMNEYQAASFVSLSYLGQPVGCLLGGLLSTRIGRKPPLILANLPIFLGWLFLFFSQNQYYLYFGSFLLGIGIGVGWSPSSTYFSELLHPSLIGPMSKVALILSTFFIPIPLWIFISLDSWRWTCLAMSLFALLAAAMAALLPESPKWMAQRGNLGQAHALLAYLRPDQSKQQIHQEVIKMAEQNVGNVNNNRLNTLTGSIQQNNNKEDNVSSPTYLKRFLEPDILKPFTIVISMHAMSYISGVKTMTPYLILIMFETGIDEPLDTTALTAGAIGIVGVILSLLLQPAISKKAIYLVGLLATGLAYTCLGLVKQGALAITWGPFLFCLLPILNLGSVSLIPGAIQNDLYPDRNKQFANGVTSSAGHLIGFLATQLFLPVSNALTLEAWFFTLGFFNLAGFLAFWYALPGQQR